MDPKGLDEQVVRPPKPFIAAAEPLEQQEAGVELSGGGYPVVVPYFMREIVEEITIAARKSK